MKNWNSIGSYYLLWTLLPHSVSQKFKKNIPQIEIREFEPRRWITTSRFKFDPPIQSWRSRRDLNRWFKLEPAVGSSVRSRPGSNSFNLGSEKIYNYAIWKKNTKFWCNNFLLKMWSENESFPFRVLRWLLVVFSL